MSFRILIGSCILLVSCTVLGCATQLWSPIVSEEELDEESAAQMALAVETYLDRQARLDRVSKRLAVAAPDLCGENVDHAFGITWASAEDLSDRYQQIAPRVGLTGGVQIWDIVPDLAAARAKIKPKTSVVTVNGKSVGDFESLSAALSPSWESGRLRLELRQGPGKPLRDITIRGKKACSYVVVLVEDDSVNAWADGKRVLIPVGMMRFADRDEELALVVGHEMAHNSLGHVREKKVTRNIGRIPGMLFDLVASIIGFQTNGGFANLGGNLSEKATSSRSRNFESDADYMGLYMARRAKYDIAKAQHFWREMAAEYPASIKGNMLASHPTTPHRSAALQAAVKEIRLKERKGRRLVPEGEGSFPANQE